MDATSFFTTIFIDNFPVNGSTLTLIH